MSLDYTILAAELLIDHPISGVYNANDQLAADQINTLDIETIQKVDYSDVASYLMVVYKYLAISESTAVSAKTFMLAMSTFKTFDLNKPLVYNTILVSLDNLISDVLLDETDKLNILALANTITSRAQELRLNNISSGDITYARSL